MYVYCHGYDGLYVFVVVITFELKFIAGGYSCGLLSVINEKCKCPLFMPFTCVEAKASR